MKLTNEEIIEKIRKNGDWINATDLSNIFGVSTRTIRNRVNEINRDKTIIDSSYKGYRYIGSTQENKLESDEKQNQILFVLRKLIAADKELNIYDLADEMYVSDTQFSRILDQVKEFLDTYDINLIRYRNMISLEKKEKNIRRLIRFLIKDQENGFLASEEIGNYIDEKELENLKKNLQGIIENCGIYVNDYGFQTILLHVVIMIKRYRDDNFMGDSFTGFLEENKYNLAAKEIRFYLKANFKIRLTATDTKNLSLLIANNCNDIDSDTIAADNIGDYVDEKYFNLTSSVLEKLAENYCLDSFDQKFIINLTLHIKNLTERARSNTFTPNPLTNKFKEQNALIYDMATFVANEIRKIENIEIVDDEIAFIAFHIGYYFETYLNSRSKVNCCFVYADYHMMYLQAIDKIMEQFSAKANMVAIISIRDLARIPDNIELIISSAGPVKRNDVPVIETVVFISDSDISNINAKLDEIIQKKKNIKVIDGLKRFVNESLFKKEVYANDEFEMIQKMSKDCFELHLIDSSFAQEVIEREKLSSTSFSNNVAIPHSLNSNARQSFLYFISNKKEMKWGNNNVNLIMLIGASTKDKKAFNDVFSGIINVLYKKENVRALSLCEDYSTFIDTLFNMIINYKD